MHAQVPVALGELIHAQVRAAIETAVHEELAVALGAGRAIRDHGHCGFAVAEEETAFADLVNWVTNAVKPAGDDILTPAVVADPKFGCAFSLPGHAGFPAC